jgi:hypothetical protein
MFIIFFFIVLILAINPLPYSAAMMFIIVKNTRISFASRYTQKIYSYQKEKLINFKGYLKGKIFQPNIDLM